jgi:hypothetical protein
VADDDERHDRCAGFDVEKGSGHDIGEDICVTSFSETTTDWKRPELFGPGTARCAQTYRTLKMQFNAIRPGASHGGR